MEQRIEKVQESRLMPAFGPLPFVNQPLQLATLSSSSVAVKPQIAKNFKINFADLLGHATPSRSRADKEFGDGDDDGKGGGAAR